MITPTRSAKDQFDKQATHYNAQWNTWTQESLTWLLDHSRHQPSDTVLDVATGTGFTALAFAPYVHSVIGQDVSSGMLEQARQRAQEQGITNVAFQECPAEALPFSDKSFDIVSCRIAAHHFLDVRTFVSEAARVLKIGGRFVLADTTVPDSDPEAADWQNQAEILRDPSHVQNYTPQEWHDLIETAGLSVLESSNQDGGTTIPLSDWMVKAGCTPDQSEIVRQHFADAPESAEREFQIRSEPDGEIVFTWQRVVIQAIKE